MNEENNVTEIESNETDYIAEIENLRANTVDKSMYNKLAVENKRLIEALARGEKITQEQKTSESIDDLRKAVFNNPNITNLEYIEKSLALRDRLIESGARDPFLPIGSHVTVTPEEIAAAENTAAGLKEMVEAAQGDPHSFNLIYQARVKDNPMLKLRR